MTIFKIIIITISFLLSTRIALADQPMQKDENTIAVWRMEKIPVPAESIITGKKPFDLKVSNGDKLQLVKGKFGKAVTGFSPQGKKDNRYLTPPAYTLPNPTEQTFEAWICWPDEKSLPQNCKIKQTLWRVSGSRVPLHFFFSKNKDGKGMITIKFQEAKGAKKKEKVSSCFEEPLKAGAWYHIAYSLKQNGTNLEVKLYCNKEKGKNTKPKPVIAVNLKDFKYDNGTFVARLGEEGHTGSDPFQGLIDEVKLSNIARTVFPALGK